MSCMFVPNLDAISRVTLVLRPETPPEKFGVKSRLNQKRLKYSKKYFTRLYVLKYPFIPTNPFFGCDDFFLFFFSS